MPDHGGPERLPPQSREAERSVLGSMLRNNAVIDDVLGVIDRPDMFYSDAHQKIFAAITTLHDKRNTPVDLPLSNQSLSAVAEMMGAKA